MHAREEEYQLLRDCAFSIHLECLRQHSPKVFPELLLRANIFAARYLTTMGKKLLWLTNVSSLRWYLTPLLFFVQSYLV